MQDLKAAFDTYTDADEPPMLLQSGALLAAARRSRQRRRVGRIAGFVAVAAAVTLAMVPLLSPVNGQLRVTPAAEPVDTAAVIESAVQAWAGPDYANFTLDSAYPSDWTRVAALPPGEAANATDWHVRWSLPNGEFLTVSLMYFGPNWGGLTCDPPNCAINAPGGNVTTLTDVYPMADGLAQVAREHRGDGFGVLIWLQSPTGTFSYTPAQMLELAADPTLTFPYPAVLPTGTPLTI